MRYQLVEAINEQRSERKSDGRGRLWQSPLPHHLNGRRQQGPKLAATITPPVNLHSVEQTAVHGFEGKHQRRTGGRQPL